MWGYTPVGPRFRYELHGDHVDTSLRIFEVWAGLDGVIERFAEHALPQKSGTYCFVLDQAGVAILGYDTTTAACQTLGPYGRWFGVEAAFSRLEARHDPMECAVWETMAKEYVW